MFNKNMKQLYIIFIITSLVMSLSIILIEKIFFHDTPEQVALDSAPSKLKEREQRLDTFLESSRNTLTTLRNSDFFNDYVSGNRDDRLIKQIFLACAQSNPEFMQLRYIDKDGNEKLRVERNSSGSDLFLVPEDKLQNKANRYYFLNSKTKELEKVWFSEFDLNIEHGVVEIPYKPTLRAVLPIAKEGKFDGILIVNYFMQNFLEKFTTTPLYDFILFDDCGYIIYHYDSEKNWSSYKEKNYNIADEFPEYADKILEQEFLRTEKFVAKKLKNNISGGLHLSLQLDAKYIEREKKLMQEQYIMVVLFVVFMPLVLIYILSRFYGKTLMNLDKLENLNQKLKCNEEALKKSKDELDLIFDKASEGISLLDLDKRYIKVNQKYTELLGYSQEELIGKFCREVTAPEFVQKSLDVYEEALEKGYYDNFQRECITKSGELKILSSSIVFMPNEKYYLVTTVDQTELYKMMKQIKQQSYLDELTQLQNRKAYNQRMEELFAKYKRYGNIFSMLIFDIDFFKQINDTYGHQAGDDVLVRLAKILKKTVRKSDYVFRIGGEEFVILLTETKKKDAITFAEKLRSIIEEELRPAQEEKITVSIGVTEICKTDTIESIYSRVDENLYFAKENGRNRVISHL